MSIITITTDFGLKDYALAAVKGRILTELPDARLVDISHDVAPFDLEEAAYLVKNAYPNFPKNTVHIIGVDALPNEKTRLLAAKIDGHYFLAADNGILSLILSEIRPEKMVEITLGKYDEYSNFPTRDIFVPVACHLIRGGLLEIIGSPTESYKELSHVRPHYDEDRIKGTVIYIDNFGNIISNVTQTFFEKIRRGRAFEIKTRDVKTDVLHKRYCDVVKDFNEETNSHGEKIVLFNSAGYLEIAIYKPIRSSHGTASSLIGLSKGDSIYIEFK